MGFIIGALEFIANLLGRTIGAVVQAVALNFGYLLLGVLLVGLAKLFIPNDKGK